MMERILVLPLPEQIFLRDTLVPLADRNAIYVDAAYFDPLDRMRAQVARDEAISPFVISRNRDTLPPYVLPLLQRAKRESTRVHFGDVQIVSGGGRLLLPVAGAVVADGSDCGTLAIHVDLVSRIMSALVASARSERTFLCLYDIHGRPLFELDERNQVSIASGDDFAKRFPELAELGLSQRDMRARAARAGQR